MNASPVVLSTVNAPHLRTLDAGALALCLTDIAQARANPGHMSVFFGEVTPEFQLAFAREHGIARTTLVDAARSFASFSGETYPLAA